MLKKFLKKIKIDEASFNTPLCTDLCIQLNYSNFYYDLITHTKDVKSTVEPSTWINQGFGILPEEIKISISYNKKSVFGLKKISYYNLYFNTIS